MISLNFLSQWRNRSAVPLGAASKFQNGTRGDDDLDVPPYAINDKVDSSPRHPSKDVVLRFCPNTRYSLESPCVLPQYGSRHLNGSIFQIPETTKERVLFPMSPAWSERYIRPGDVNPVKAQYVIQPATRTFFRDNVPPEWIALTHPEGMLYFFNEARNIITDAYISDPLILTEIEHFYLNIENRRKAADITVPQDAQLVMDLMPAESNSEEIICGYYFVDHEHRSLFWVEAFDAEYLLRDIRGEVSPTLIQYEIESQYWKHREYFPGLNEITEDAAEELRQILVHSIGDTLTSDVSTSPYSIEKLMHMLNLMDTVKDYSKQNSHFETYLSRMMSTFAHSRFIARHGQKTARLSRTQSIHLGNSKRRSLTMTLLSPILFLAPDEHMQGLENIYVDGIVTEAPWITFIEKLNRGWQEFPLLAEVLLIVNVSFLAIPSVDITGIGQYPDPHRSLARIASYVSIGAAIGSISVGLLLVRKVNVQRYNSAEKAADLLTSTRLDTLAILYSLPYALLMWGLTSFVVAFCASCFSATELPSTSLVGVTGATVLALVLWCVWTNWDMQTTRSSVWSGWWNASSVRSPSDDAQSQV